MKWFVKVKKRLKGLTYAVIRYPLTSLFLLVAATIMAVSIQMVPDYGKQILTCVVGAVLSASLQVAYERFSIKTLTRYLLMGSGIVLTFFYYLILRSIPKISTEIGIRTWVALFALCIAFIWIPVIRSSISFNESFMIAFKAFFRTLFYAVTIYIGCMFVFFAINNLLIHVSDKLYAHTGNIVFILFAPLYFLSLIPIYPGKRDADMKLTQVREQEKQIHEASDCPPFLEILISYIIIPITAVYTAILILYIIRNLKEEFWTNNLLEPMLVSYIIAVIFLSILCGKLENKIVVLFRMLFPKVLIPIVLFQMISSIIALGETGVTHTRYFVILFCVFAFLSSIVMSFSMVKKNGTIAGMLILFSAISVIPPIDAFTVSRLSQENTLRSLLMQNKMLEDNTVIPKASISNTDKEKIVSIVTYLNNMSYLNQVKYLPADFSVYEDFYATFGFYEYEMPENQNHYKNVYLNSLESINIANYDILAHTYVNFDETMTTQICKIEKSGKKYTLEKQNKGGRHDIILRNENEQEIITFNVGEIFQRYQQYTVEKSELDQEEATFSIENNRVRLTVVVENANMNSSVEQTYDNAEIYILVKFK